MLQVVFTPARALNKARVATFHYHVWNTAPAKWHQYPHPPFRLFQIHSVGLQWGQQEAATTQPLAHLGNGVPFLRNLLKPLECFLTQSL